MNRQELHKAGWLPLDEFDDLVNIATVGMLLAYCPHSSDTFYTAIVDSLELDERDQMIGAITEEEAEAGWGDVDDPIIQYEKRLSIRRTDTLEGESILMVYNTVGDYCDSIDGWYYLPH